MSRKRKANITPTDVGNYYTNGKGIYQLLECETSPHATMQQITGDHSPEERPISEFADFVRLKPEKEIPKPDKPRKQRADAGGHHKVKPGKIDIEKIEIAVAHADQPNMAAYKNTAAASSTIQGAILDLFRSFNIDGVEKVKEYVKAQPDSANKKILLNALGG